MPITKLTFTVVVRIENSRELTENEIESQLRDQVAAHIEDHLRRAEESLISLDIPIEGSATITTEDYDIETEKEDEVE